MSELEQLLALFVAPVLLDAAYDASLRDLKDNWIPLAALVIICVALTTIAVAIVAQWFIPALAWAPAIALGAIVAPPDAVAATAVLRQLKPPHRMTLPPNFPHRDFILGWLDLTDDDPSDAR